MQKKKQKQNNIIKQIILYTLVVIIAILLTFAEDIVKLANKNKVGLLENTPNEITVAETNIPAISAGMIPIKWETDHYVITTAKDNDWYEYKSGKPAYIMLNDGVYQSELVRNMEANGQKLADKNVGNDAIAVPDIPDNNPTILMWIPRFAINDETNDVKYIKNVETAEEGWTIPEMFTYKQEKETAPDFLLTGIWFEIDVDTSYTNKIKQMNQEESIYGFIANTKAVASDQTTGNEIQNYYNTLIENTVGVGVPDNPQTDTTNNANNVGASIARPQIDDITNPNRIILKIINQKNQDPIKVKASYNKDTGLIEIQVTYTQNGINKILLENEHELTFSKINGITTADTTGIDLEDGKYTITIIDNKGNKKELKIQVISAIYATLYTDGTLAFGKSENPLPEKTISESYGDIAGKEYGYTKAPWYNKRTSITTVEFVNKIKPISTAYWFWGCTNLTTINNINNFDTKNVTDMGCMFSTCSSLTSLDLSNLDTGNVTNMGYMFSTCSSLTSLDLSNLDTKNVTNMSSMFNTCSSLTSIDLSNLDTRNVTNMSSMFSNCSSLTSLNLSNFDTSNVTNMTNMFFCCSSLTSIDLSNFDTNNVTTMRNMFYSCSKLTSLNLSNFDTRNVTSMDSMFHECSSLSNLDLSDFDTRNVTGMNSMFYECSSLSNLDLSDFDTRNVTSMNNMFYECSGLSNLDLTSFDTNNVTDISYIFNNCSSLTQISFGEKWNKEITLPKFTKPSAGWYSDAEFTKKVAEVGANYTPAVPITIYAKLPPAYYGELVTNYTCSNTGVSAWRVFHKDDNGRVYLIADDYVPYDNLPTTTEGTALTKGGEYKAYWNTTALNNYTGSAWIRIHTNGNARKWLSWVNSYTNSTYINIRAVAYMMDTDKWSSFAGDKAEYAIGGPTIELFCASYNVTHPDRRISRSMKTYGYEVYWSGSDTLTMNDYNKIYMNSDTSKASGMWIASPSAESSGYVICTRINGGGGVVDSYNCGARNYGFRPVVCLKSGVELVNNGDGTYSIQ